MCVQKQLREAVTARFGVVSLWYMLRSLVDTLAERVLTPAYTVLPAHERHPVAFNGSHQERELRYNRRSKKEFAFTPPLRSRTGPCRSRSVRIIVVAPTCSGTRAGVATNARRSHSSFAMRKKRALAAPIEVAYSSYRCAVNECRTRGGGGDFLSPDPFGKLRALTEGLFHRPPFPSYLNTTSRHHYTFFSFSPLGYNALER